MLQNRNYATLTLCAILLCACNISVGTNQDLATGLSYSYNGFAVEEVLLVGQDNVPMDDNEVQLDTKVAIVVQGLTNYVLRDDKAFPGLMISLTDEAGNTILEEADLFADNDGYSAEDASVLRGTVTVGQPMKSGETYHFKMRVWDKVNTKNELTANVDLVVK